MIVKLISSDTWKLATKEDRDKYSGGCGPGKFGDWLVPDTMWGLCVSEACNIHDWMYAYGVTANDRKEADDILLRNLYILIDNDSPTWLFRKLRRVRARTYYFWVRSFGWKHYKTRDIQ